MKPGPNRAYAALAGLLAGALAIAVSILIAGITQLVSPIDAVGSEVIDSTPTSVREWAIREFGTNDKLMLRIGIYTVIGLIALALGAACARRPYNAAAGIVVFGIVGAMAAAARPGASAGAMVPSLLGAVAGGVVVVRLLRQNAPEGPLETPHESRVPLGWDRRRFLIAGGATAAVAVVGGGIGVGLERNRVASLRRDASRPLPELGGPSVEVPEGAQLFDSTPYITPVGDFYRIDTALSFPNVNVDRWKVTIKGMVDREVSYSYADLLAMPQQERLITLCCVSNSVGGKYVGNGKWRGVMLRDLLDEAGVQSGAEQVYSTSLDGWTCGFPVSAAYDGRDAMVVLGMNGETLPLEHGFPARLVVPGLYGYVSATKWLSEIRLTTWDDQGYWVPLGWAQEAPVKTQSRIDVPRGGAKLTAGKQPIAGVAWAQHRGIDKVEVRIDEGDWIEADLGTDVTDDAWRQWLVEWDATPGEHKLEVRATDKTGEVQTEEVFGPPPAGATGHHRIRVKVS
jgi:DMSO/TMAO reductase YedYZ molybdopterin-dependent catalytic subunit